MLDPTTGIAKRIAMTSTASVEKPSANATIECDDPDNEDFEVEGVHLPIIVSRPNVIAMTPSWWCLGGAAKALTHARIC
jgi:hypothetical protein